MAIRYEVYNTKNSRVYKVCRTEADANKHIFELLLPMSVGGAPSSDMQAISHRQIEVPDARFICRGCHKEFYADPDMSCVGATVTCPHCHGQYYAKYCLPDYYRRGDGQSVQSRVDVEQSNSKASKLRMMERKQWNMMSYSDREQARRDMEIIGNYWGPEHEGYEYWL